jgi:hypothetical protein
MAFQGVRHRGQHHDVLSEADLQLFTEVEAHEPEEATASGPLPSGQLR